MDWLALLFGVVVGFSLGLTGGGGSLFAVPLLVYGLAVGPREAIGISLASVGITSLVGTIERLRADQVEWRTGLLFSIAGMIGAPGGAWMGERIAEPVLLLLFALLMVAVAGRMWWNSSPRGQTKQPEVCEPPTCQRDDSGTLVLTSRCAVLLVLVGLLTGVMSGLFGVGGGFLIVPALVIFSGMRIHRAVATSLLVITLVSISGLGSYLLAGRSLDPAITLLFIMGGISGLFAGNSLGRRISGSMLQRIFGMAILGVGLFIIIRTLT